MTDVIETTASGPDKRDRGGPAQPMLIVENIKKYFPIRAGLLNKKVLDGRAVYEHDYGYPQHDHLYCTGCRKLIEFSSDEVAKICDAVASRHQFRAQSHRLIVSGLCAVCRSSKSSSRHQDRV